jgi:hypothetical protein
MLPPPKLKYRNNAFSRIMIPTNIPATIVVILLLTNVPINLLSLVKIRRGTSGSGRRRLKAT